jgi:hypothetical protein
MAKSKTVCPVTREEFKQHAKPLQIVIGDRTFHAGPREFSTGSLGWNVSEKMYVEINGHQVALQVGLNITVVGSKDLPGAASAPPA